MSRCRTLSDGEKNSRFRRVPESEKKGRAWPDKSLQASSHPGMFTPDLAKKNPIYSVITALPVIMLLVGLVFWYQGENAQQSGSPIIAESVTLNGQFNGVSKATAAGEGQFFYWLIQNGDEKTLRISPDQYTQFSQGELGSQVSVTAAPTISGSATLWLLEVERQ